MLGRVPAAQAAAQALFVRCFAVASKAQAAAARAHPDADELTTTDVAPSGHPHARTAVHISRVPRLRREFLPRSYNTAPLPVPFFIKQAGGAPKGSYSFMFHDERTLAKEASVVSGTLVFKVPPNPDDDDNVRSRRRVDLQPRTLFQAANAIAFALGSGQPGAKQAARAIALAAVTTHSEAAAGEGVGTYGRLKRDIEESEAFQVPRTNWPLNRKGEPARRPKPPRARSPFVTQHGLTSPVQDDPRTDVLQRQTPDEQLRAARAIADVAAAAGAAAAVEGTPPPMAEGRVFGTRGAAWGAVHPAAEQLAARVRSRQLPLQGWLESLPAAQQALLSYQRVQAEEGGSDYDEDGSDGGGGDDYGGGGPDT
jgi:hypothetical protein